MPARTVSRILRRHGVPYLRECDPITGEVIRSSKQTAVRYERERPGELVHMDVKKIGRIPDGGGWRVHGRATPRDRVIGPGYDYVHSLVDDHSRLAYTEILPDEKGVTCAAFLHRAIAYFAEPRHHPDRAAHDRQRVGLPILVAISCVPSAASCRCSSSRTAPGRTAKSNDSTAPWPPSGPTAQLYTSNAERVEALAPWLEHYNTERRHSALRGHPPISRLLPLVGRLQHDLVTAAQRRQAVAGVRVRGDEHRGRLSAPAWPPSDGTW